MPNAAVASYLTLKPIDPLEVVKDIGYLFAPIRAKAVAVISEMNRHAKVRREQGRAEIEWRVVESLRSRQRQQRLYRQGRSEKGEIVTKSDGVTRLSRHQYGLAFDVAPFVKVGGKWKLAYDHPDVDWSYFGHVVRANGLEWGGDWTGGFVDEPHAQWPAIDVATYQKGIKWVRSLGY